MGEERRSSEVRQAELIDAALRLIATHGIASLTTRSLAQEVGLSTGAIFRHFTSLDVLLEAVVARVERVLDQTYPPTDLPIVDQLRRFVEARSSAVASEVGILRLMLSDQFILALPEAGTARLNACIQKTRQFVRACVVSGQASGEIRADVDATALVVIVMGTTQMLAMMTAKPNQGFDAQSVRDGLVLLLQSDARDTDSPPLANAAAPSTKLPRSET